MSQDISANNKRIAKNTIALYFRTFITMIVGLYTARVMLHALGVEDYGVNNVVGGIVAMSSFVTGTMSQAISRYLTFTLGKGDKEEQVRMFSTSVNAQILMAILIAIALEIAGVWFLNTQANIPDSRMDAANWVLQCSIISLAISLISTPYNATIIAHERMTIFAYTSISDVTLRLAICFIIQAYGGDRLILLSLLGISVSLMMQLFYGWYCKRNFSEARYSIKIFDKGLLKELTVFSGWNLFGSTAWVLNTQGVNMLVNVFFGVMYNASRGLATTISGAIINFVGNFTTAFTPQITKSYAQGNYDYSIGLANKGTKITWLMLYVFIVPVCCEADMILRLWLDDVPPMAALFLRFTMFESLATQSGSVLLKLVQADGNIKRYQIEITLAGFCVFPLSWLAYLLGAPVWSAYLIFIIVYFSINIVRYIRLKSLMPFSIRQHLMECVLPCVIVSATSFIVPLLICFNMEDGLLRFFIVVPVGILSTIVCSYLFGLSQSEKELVIVQGKKLMTKVLS